MKLSLSILLGAVVLGVIENLVNPIIFWIFHLSIEDLAVHPWVNILTFFPTLLLATITLWIIKRKNLELYDLSQTTLGVH